MSGVIKVDLTMIETDSLCYTFTDGTIGLENITCQLPTHSRTLLVGANGAGKSTLLRVLAGKTLPRAGKLLVNDSDPFRDSPSGLTYLGTEWASNPTVHRDMPVVTLIASVGGDLYPARRDELIDILDVDLRWHMNAVSDGERRRVQLCMGLLKPWSLLLIDEVTVDLDVLVRSRLLDFLVRETTSRDCQIVYATHIFDGLQNWPTHIMHLHMGRLVEVDDAAALLNRYSKREQQRRNTPALVSGSELYRLALSWLEDDLIERGVRTKRTWSQVYEHTPHPLEHSEKFGAYFRTLRFG